MSKFLAPPGLQHARLPCPSLISRVCSNSCPLSWWCHPTISSSAAPFSFYLQSLPASGSFPMSCLFTSDSRSIGASASASVFSMSLFNQPWIGLISFRIDWFDLLTVQGTLRSLLQHHSSKESILWCSTFFTVQLSQSSMTTRKTIALTIQIFVGRVTSLLFNTLSRFVIAFLPRSNRLLISWL